MTYVYLICFLLSVIAVICLLGLTPEGITTDLMKFVSPKQTLRDKVLAQKGRKKSRKLTVELNRIRDALITTGKGGQFTIACASSLLLMLIGCIVAIAIGNAFLIPVLAIAFALIPFAYAKRTISYYNNHIQQDLENALSLTTTAYINGCVPFGYRLENKVMIPFEPEAEIVRSLFQGYLNGASLTELCRYLEKQSISPRNQGAKWNVRVVSKMLSNEKYIGDSLYQKKYRETTVPFTQHINYGQEEQYYATGTHEGIVDKEIFASVQELLKKRRELYSRPEVAPAKYPFTHRIQCSECGTFYRRRIVNGSVVWGCNQHIEDRTACDSHYYREDRIMDAFIGIINRLRFAEEGIIAESIELTEKAILLKKRNNLQAMESSQSMAELNAKLLMLEQLKSKGYLAPDVFETQSREINTQINEIKTKRIQSLSSALDVALEEFKTLQARLNEIDEPLDSFDPKLFEEVIKGMTVNNRDEMTFRLIGDLTFTVRL